MKKVNERRLDLKAAFGSEFTGDPKCEKDIQKFIVDIFRKRCASARPFYHHFLTCTDIKSVNDIFVEIKRDIRDSLLRRLLPQ